MLQLNTYILHSADVGSVWQAVLYNYCTSEILQNYMMAFCVQRDVSIH